MKLNVQKVILPFGGGEFFYGHSDSAKLRDVLLERYSGKIACIYLDPPFCTGDRFTKEVEAKRVLAYSDELNFEDYMDTMRAVLSLSRELLSDTGSLYLHIDYRMSAHMRLLLDEIFGAKNFMNEIIWSYKSGGRSKNHYSRKHDTIYLYRKRKSTYFDIDSVGMARGTKRRNNMKFNVDENGLVYYSIMSGGKLYKYYETDLVYPTDVWDDIEHLHQRDKERVNYPTQKPEALLERVVSVSSPKGAVVCDLFSGSGTTAAVSDKLDRAWVVVDASPIACSTLMKRLADMHQSNSLVSPEMQSTFELSGMRNIIKKRVGFTTKRIDNGYEVTVKNAQKIGVDMLMSGSVTDGVFHATKFNTKANKFPVIRVQECDDAAIQVMLESGEFKHYSVVEILSGE